MVKTGNVETTGDSCVESKGTVSAHKKFFQRETGSAINMKVISAYTMQVHGLLHLLGFDHEISDEAEAEMEKEEESLLKSLGWKGKGLIQSAYDVQSNENPPTIYPDGKIGFNLVSLSC